MSFSTKLFQAYFPDDRYLWELPGPPAWPAPNTISVERQLLGEKACVHPFVWQCCSEQVFVDLMLTSPPSCWPPPESLRGRRAVIAALVAQVTDLDPNVAIAAANDDVLAMRGYLALGYPARQAFAHSACECARGCAAAAIAQMTPESCVTALVGAVEQDCAWAIDLLVERTGRLSPAQAAELLNAAHPRALAVCAKHDIWPAVEGDDSITAWLKVQVPLIVADGVVRLVTSLAAAGVLDRTDPFDALIDGDEKLLYCLLASKVAHADATRVVTDGAVVSLLHCAVDLGRDESAKIIAEALNEQNGCAEAWLQDEIITACKEPKFAHYLRWLLSWRASREQPAMLDEAAAAIVADNVDALQMLLQAGLNFDSVETELHKIFQAGIRCPKCAEFLAAKAKEGGQNRDYIIYRSGENTPVINQAVD